MFNLPKGKPEFSKLEESILQYWKENRTFEKSVESRPTENPYRFYDGPPFITGTPHYGSLLSSIIKDVIPRYQTMKGKRVERVWGWDCHGLPIEQKVQKKLGLESNKEIEESEGGIQKFIDECYAYTSSTSAEWGWYIDHIGRWVDMDNAYRTMDQDYMESVMWVFKQIWEKGYIYEGKRVSWYSWKLSTPISNFEIAMDDSYQDVQDPAITVKFPLKEIKKGAGAIIRDEDGKLLMIRNKKDGLWRIPGGHVEAGESYHDAAARELLEETGITCQLAPSYNFYHTYRGSFYYAERFTGTVPVGTKVQLEEDKYSDYAYFALDALPVRSEIHYIDNELFDALTGVREPAKITGPLPVSFLAWTTTPWTMPMHMALAVNNDITYAQVLCNGEVFILAQSRVETVFKGKGEYQVIGTMRGEELVGLQYKAPFDFYQKNSNSAPLSKGGKSEGISLGVKGDGIETDTNSVGEIPPAPLSQGGMFANSFRVYHADFVTDTDGTGIAHEAPEFGDVDFQLAKEKGIHITSAIDEAGKYTAEVPDYQGTLYLDAIDTITERLKTEGTLFKKEGITHRVPYCPRSNTPLIQKAQKSWFIDIQRIKKELIEQNESINWFPDHFKHGRFLKSLESAPDWCVSRSRFWGTPMPVWQNADGSERVVIDSREELYQRNKPLGQITKIILIRHAESQANVDKIYDDIGTSHLSPKGKEQALELAKALENEPIDAILSSPFTRTKETIEPLATKLGISIREISDLHETNHGLFSGKSGVGEGPEAARVAFRSDETVKFAETGESLQDIRVRCRSVIELIRKEYAGKTVVVVSHFHPVRCFLRELDSKKAIDRAENAAPNILYLDNNTGKEINLHRPYIDRIYVPSFQEKGKEKVKQRKILGVHGFRRTEQVVDFLGATKEHFEKKNISFVTPFFQSGESADYKTWEKVFDENFTDDIDTVVTHSMGARAVIEYIIARQKKIKRLVMVAPGIISKSESVQKFYNELTQNFGLLKNFVDDRIVISSQDDVGREGYGKTLAEAINATHIEVNGYGHFNIAQCSLIENIVENGVSHQRTLKVLGVHGKGTDMATNERWKGRIQLFREAGLELECFQCDKANDPTYESWRETFDTIDFSQYDAIFTISLGGAMLVKYLAEKKIKVPRLVMATAGISVSAENGEKPNVLKIGTDLFSIDGKKIADEIIVVHAKDDEIVPYENAKKIAEHFGVKIITLETGGHTLADYNQLFAGLVKTGTPLRRIPEVLDVWMDSASMPYAQVHYPFENEAKMEASFPADFIAEYTGQIRAWFYVMHVLGVIVKGSPAFKNVAVTGVINGTDGRKMSKSFGNYPDPRETIEKYGADAIRFYLMGGTLMKGEDMTFSEAGIGESIKRVLLPLWNAYTFFATYANIDGFSIYEEKVKEKSKREECVSVIPDKGGVSRTRSGIQEDQLREASNIYLTPKTHELDTWIISRLHTLIQDIRTSMDSYDLQKTCDTIMVFLDGLNNWYIRRNRRRFWRSELDADKKSAYETLHEVLVTITKLLAPICPFITEYLYQNLTNSNKCTETVHTKDGKNEKTDSNLCTMHYALCTGESVHLTFFPQVNVSLINLAVNQKMADLQNLTNLGLAIRGREKLRVRQPLRAATITLELDQSARETLAEELNVKEIHAVKDVSEYVTITYSPDAKKIGATERKQWMKTIIADAKAGKGILTPEGALELTVQEAPHGKVILAADEFEAVYTPKEGSTIAFAGSAGYVIGLDTTLDEELTLEGYARDMIRGIQDTRKELGFQVTDRLQLSLSSDNTFLAQVLATHQTMIEKETLTTITPLTSHRSAVVEGAEQGNELGGLGEGSGKELEIDEGFVVKLTLNK